MSRRIVFALVLALVACNRDAPAPTVSKKEPEIVAERPTPDADIDNSLNLMYGATVVSRNGELHLGSSAIHTIDGYVDTLWTSPPGVPDNTIVYSMLAPTRIDRVGVTTSEGDDVMETVIFEASMDGKKWTEIATLKPARTAHRQIMGVKPTVAQYLRVQTRDPKKFHVRIRGVHALGEEVAPPRTPSFGGCWTINGALAHLEQNGARITGVIASDPPTYIDGGTDNRAAKVMWMQAPMWGYAVLTRSPDGKSISGLTFFDEPELYSIGEGWFGERCSAETNVGRASARPIDFFTRTKRYPLMGLVFAPDETLVEELSAPALDDAASIVAASPQTRFRVVAHELRYDTKEENRQRAAARLQAVRAALQRRGVDLARIEFVAEGSENYKPILRSALQRAFASRIDLLSGS